MWNSLNAYSSILIGLKRQLSRRYDDMNSLNTSSLSCVIHRPRVQSTLSALYKTTTTNITPSNDRNTPSPFARKQPSSHVDNTQHRSTHQVYSQQDRMPLGSKFKWCGRVAHVRKECPAKDAVYRFCNIKGHFQSEYLYEKQCVLALDTDSSHTEELLIGSINIDSLVSAIMVPLTVGQSPVTF